MAEAPGAPHEQHSHGRNGGHHARIMSRAAAFCWFALDRARTVLLALSLIVLLKLVWVLALRALI